MTQKLFLTDYQFNLMPLPLISPPNSLHPLHHFQTLHKKPNQYKNSPSSRLTKTCQAIHPINCPKKKFYHSLTGWYFAFLPLFEQIIVARLKKKFYCEKVQNQEKSFAAMCSQPWDFLGYVLGVD
jgi:hypothetical protein